jgi:hypothetical protein
MLNKEFFKPVQILQVNFLKTTMRLENILEIIFQSRKNAAGSPER